MHVANCSWWISRPVSQSPVESFAKMKDLYDRHQYLDTLSMGMSKDYISAIEYNANMLRIGQQIFGKRTW